MCCTVYFYELCTQLRLTTVLKNKRWDEMRCDALQFCCSWTLDYIFLCSVCSMYVLCVSNPAVAAKSNKPLLLHGFVGHSNRLRSAGVSLAGIVELLRCGRNCNMQWQVKCISYFTTVQHAKINKFAYAKNSTIFGLICWRHLTYMSHLFGNFTPY